MLSRRVTLFWILLAACGDDDDDATPESCATDSLTMLESSERTWRALAAESGDDYWYEEENCVVNAPQGDVTAVQVSAGVAEQLGSESIARSECAGLVNRYATFTPQPFEQLAASCRQLVARECAAVQVELDARGVLRSCTWPGDGSCSDNCGEGFLVRAWDFGPR